MSIHSYFKDISERLFLWLSSHASLVMIHSVVDALVEICCVKFETFTLYGLFMQIGFFVSKLLLYEITQSLIVSKSQFNLLSSYLHFVPVFHFNAATSHLNVFVFLLRPGLITQELFLIPFY